MKISKSKQELARIISENGGWRDSAEFAWYGNQTKKGWFGISKPRYSPKQKSLQILRPHLAGSFPCRKPKNWHQTILSRAEYLHLYPAPDADGWIEWKGGECPVDVGSVVDVRKSNGLTYKARAANFHWNLITGSSCVVAYRLHKHEKYKPEFCESVMRSIPAPESKPTIEQLAADYRNAKDYANRKQQEADDARDDADAKLKTLEMAGEASGLIVTPITAKQEPELVITNRSQLELGDVIWLSDSTVKENNELTPSGEYTVVKVGMIGVESDDQTIYPDFSTREWRFIRRP